MKKSGNRIKLFNLNVFSSSKVELLALLRSHLEDSRKLAHIVTPNPEQVVLAQKQPDFRQALEAADYQLPDGAGLVWASRVLGSKQEQIEERIAGVDVVAGLLAIAFELSLPVLILGGRNYQHSTLRTTAIRVSGAGVGAAELFELRSQYAPLTLPKTYWTPGYEGVARPTAQERAFVESVMLERRPAIVFVAFGAPYQELWMQEHRELLERAGVKVVMATGGSFDFLLGRVPRAPRAVQRAGLEWLYRLLVQPWRWRRQLSLLKFIARVLRARVQR